MFIVGSFDYSLHLELAISELEELGIPRGSIVAVPLNKRMEKRKVLDSIHHADGLSLFDGAAAAGTLFMIFGAIYGFVLPWGPIIWGIIGLIAGGILGLVGDILISVYRNHQRSSVGMSPALISNSRSEVFLLVECNDSQAELVTTTLWDNLANGVGSF